MKVEILGSSGCSTCEQLKANVQKIIEEMEQGNDIEVVKVEDPVKVASYGVMSTPALVVDGEIKYKGRVPSGEEIRDILS